MTTFTQDMLAIGPQKAWSSFIATDSAVLHATLSFAALHRGLLLTSGEPIGRFPEFWYHRGEAMRLVQTKLSASQAIDDALLGTVALLINVEVR
jgi:hypothetical protein